MEIYNSTSVINIYAKSIQNKKLKKVKTKEKGEKMKKTLKKITKKDSNLINKDKQNGITLIALVITIIVLLILASVSIAMITGDNGILNQSKYALEQNQIGEEKEQISLAMTYTNANYENKDNFKLRKETFQNYLNNNVGKGKTKAYINGNGFTVHFLETDNLYTIDGNKIIEEPKNILEVDNTTGKLEGSGTAEDNYVIESIEDLLEWSKNFEIYSSKYIKLGKTLDFHSELSYCDYTTNLYNEMLQINDNNVTLFEALTDKKYNGFKPIELFQGEFNGNENSLKNIYIKSNGSTGGIIRELNKGKIVNLSIEGNIEGNGYVGGIASLLTGDKAIIENCIFSGNIQNISQEETYQGTGRNSWRHEWNYWNPINKRMYF